MEQWEKQHFEALQNLYTSVRQDFFSAGGFAPFQEWAPPLSLPVTPICCPLNT